MDSFDFFSTFEGERTVRADLQRGAVGVGNARSFSEERRGSGNKTDC